jgi:hypothetical protein
MEAGIVEEDMVVFMVALQKLTCLLRAGLREVVDGVGVFRVLAGGEVDC